jgi:hypothetical protein
MVGRALKPRQVDRFQEWFVDWFLEGCENLTNDKNPPSVFDHGH